MAMQYKNSTIPFTAAQIASVKSDTFPVGVKEAVAYIFYNDFVPNENAALPHSLLVEHLKVHYRAYFDRHLAQFTDAQLRGRIWTPLREIVKNGSLWQTNFPLLRSDLRHVSADDHECVLYALQLRSGPELAVAPIGFDDPNLAILVQSFQLDFGKYPTDNRYKLRSKQQVKTVPNSKIRMDKFADLASVHLWMQSTDYPAHNFRKLHICLHGELCRLEKIDFADLQDYTDAISLPTVTHTRLFAIDRSSLKSADTLASILEHGMTAGSVRTGETPILLFDDMRLQAINLKQLAHLVRKGKLPDETIFGFTIKAMNEKFAGFDTRAFEATVDRIELFTAKQVRLFYAKDSAVKRQNRFEAAQEDVEKGKALLKHYERRPVNFNAFSGSLMSDSKSGGAFCTGTFRFNHVPAPQDDDEEAEDES